MGTTKGEPRKTQPGVAGTKAANHGSHESDESGKGTTVDYSDDADGDRSGHSHFADSWYLRNPRFLVLKSAQAAKNFDLRITKDTNRMGRKEGGRAADGANDADVGRANRCVWR